MSGLYVIEEANLESFDIAIAAQAQRSRQDICMDIRGMYGIIKTLFNKLWDRCHRAVAVGV